MAGGAYDINDLQALVGTKASSADLGTAAYLDTGSGSTNVLTKTIADTLYKTILGVDTTAGYVTPEMFGADGTGVNDCTSAVQQAHNTGLPVLYGGKYNILGSITITNKPFIMFGGGTINAVAAKGSAYYFILTNCTINVSNITFELNDLADNCFNMSKCDMPKFSNCKFRNSAATAATTEQRNIFRAAYCPDIQVTGCTFYRIGDVGGGSTEVANHYRCVGLNSGCDRNVVANNTFIKCFAPVNIGEFPVWLAGKTYNVGDRVVWYSGSDTVYDDGQWGYYNCVQTHVSSAGVSAPSNSSYWTLLEANIQPHRQGSFTGNHVKNLWDNAVYLNSFYDGIYSVTGNTFSDCRDEPVAIAGGTIVVNGNTFRNIRNKAIAIDNRYVDLREIVVTNNTFYNDAHVNGPYGQFLGIRDINQPYVVKSLVVSNNTIRYTYALGNLTAIYFDKVNYITFTGNIFDAPLAQYEKILRFSGSVTDGIIANNIFNTAAVDATPISYDDPSNTNLLINSNKFNAQFSNVTPTIISNLDYLNTTGNYIKENTTKMLWADAAPTSGNWVRGSVIFNKSPVAGSRVGWVCTSSGVPGTWKAFGAILT